ncbi:MAG: T9SS type A sorting domain-containing protein [Saprospiraceae bacterium]|nr:T9SS type A sorting domain-containing protein [Saprospiraceae bacterium]
MINVGVGPTSCFTRYYNSFKFVDACGNESATYTILVDLYDKAAPSIECPPAITITCPDDPDNTALTGIPTGEDACDTDLEFTYVDASVPGVCPIRETITRTWTANDGCGNTNSCDQTIVLEDYSAPIPDQGPGGADATVNLIYADYHDGTSHTHDCPNDLYLYHSPSGYITFNGTNLIFEHYHGGETEIVVSPTATDDCGTVTRSINYGATTEDASMLPCTLKINLVWDFNDGCGNISQFTQVITIVDKAPLGINPNAPDLDQTVECSGDLNLDPADLGGDIPNPSQTADVDVFYDYDDCVVSIPIQPQGAPVSGGPNGLYWQDEITPGACPQSYMITRSWWAIDECGNVSEAFLQEINVEDNGLPTADQGPGELDSQVDLIYADYHNATNHQHDCPTDLYQFHSPSSYLIYNGANLIFDHLHGDETETLPAPSGIDDCGVVTASINYGASTEDASMLPCTLKINLVWDLTDECGNVTPYSQEITIVDLAPLAINPNAPDFDEVVDCTVNTDPVDLGGDIPNPSQNIDVDVFYDYDDCAVFIPIQPEGAPAPGVPTGLYWEDDLTPGNCPETYTIYRTWWAIDECGNVSAPFIQTIQVQDLVAPTWNQPMPANATVECNAVPSPASPITASDACDSSVLVTFTETSTKSTDVNSCAYMSYTITRTWTAADNCGNQIQHTQTITVVDTQAPVLVGVPANVTVECDAVPAAAVVTATDNCDPSVPVTLTQTSTKSADVNACAYMNYTITRTWKASDNCGNMTARTQVITVRDTKPPVLIGVPVNVTVQCHLVPDPAVVTATDNCDPDVPVTYVQSIIPGPCTDTYTINRTWSASDNCGNSTAKTQTINVIDTTKPTALCKDHTAYLNNNGEAMIFLFQIDNGSYDNCTLASLTLSKDKFDCDDIGANTVTLIATDACGNVGTCTATVTVIDALAPHMVCTTPIDLYMDAFGTPHVLTPQDVDGGSTDNCGIETLEITKSMFDCSDLGENVIKLIATDKSGNQGQCSSTIRVYDLLPPVFVFVPADQTVYCDEYDTPDDAEATDNCEVVSIVLTETQQVLPNGPSGSYLVHRVWVATDLAANTASAEQWITVLEGGQLVVNCHPDVQAQPSQGPIAIDWDDPTVDDVCAGTFEMTQIGGPPSGSYFNPDSQTRITYEYVDGYGTSYECSFWVNVPTNATNYIVVINQAADCGDVQLSKCTATNMPSPNDNSLQIKNKKGVIIDHSLASPGMFEMFADGSARLQGSWTDGSGNGWDGDIRFFPRRTHTGWTNAGGSVENPNNSGDPTTWNYFEVDASGSSLVGTGSNAGIQLGAQQSPNHPSNGLQVGNGANTVSAGNGAWVVLGAVDANGKVIAEGTVRLNLNCQQTGVIKSAGEVISLDGGVYPSNWTNGSANPLMGDAAPGVYSVNVTDQSGNVKSHMFRLDLPTGCILHAEDNCNEVNVAANTADASQISTWLGNTADRAVDGNTDGDLNNGSVSSTIAGWQNWWKADLQDVHQIEALRIWNRTDCCGQTLAPVYVFLSPNPIPDMAPENMLALPNVKATIHYGPVGEMMTIPVGGYAGRFIKVQLAESGKLSLAEVEAVVCDEDRLGIVPGAFVPDGSGVLSDPVVLMSGLSVWPNPAGDYVNLNVTMDIEAPVTVSIVNIHGQQVYRQDLDANTHHSLRVEVGHWQAGLYFATASGPDGTQSMSFSVNK